MVEFRLKKVKSFIILPQKTSFFELRFTPCKAKQVLHDRELKEKKEEKD